LQQKYFETIKYDEKRGTEDNQLSLPLGSQEGGGKDNGELVGAHLVQPAALGHLKTITI